MSVLEQLTLDQLIGAGVQARDLAESWLSLTRCFSKA